MHVSQRGVVNTFAVGTPYKQIIGVYVIVNFNVCGVPYILFASKQIIYDYNYTQLKNICNSNLFIEGLDSNKPVCYNIFNNLVKC